MTPEQERAAIVAAGLTKAEIIALRELPLPRDADPVRWIAARPYSNLWRKASNHWFELIDLEERGLVERKSSRNETLWRLTRPLGLAVRNHLQKDSSNAG